MRMHQRVRRGRKGLQVVGPGFYLWDLDAREAIRLATELGRRPARLPVPQRRAPLRSPVA